MVKVVGHIAWCERLQRGRIRCKHNIKHTWVAKRRVVRRQRVARMQAYGSATGDDCCSIGLPGQSDGDGANGHSPRSGRTPSHHTDGTRSDSNAPGYAGATRSDCRQSGREHIVASETAKHDDSNGGGKAECMTNDRHCTGWRQCSLIIYAEQSPLGDNSRHVLTALSIAAIDKNAL